MMQLIKDPTFVYLSILIGTPPNLTKASDSNFIINSLFMPPSKVTETSSHFQSTIYFALGI